MKPFSDLWTGTWATWKQTQVSDNEDQFVFSQEDFAMDWKVKIFASYMRATITQSGDELLTADDAVKKTRDDYMALPSYDQRRYLATAPMKAKQIGEGDGGKGSGQTNKGRAAMVR